MKETPSQGQVFYLLLSSWSGVTVVETREIVVFFINSKGAEGPEAIPEEGLAVRDTSVQRGSSALGLSGANPFHSCWLGLYMIEIRSRQFFRLASANNLRVG